MRRLWRHQMELLGQKWLQIAGTLRLPLAHRVNHLNPSQNRASTIQRLEADHRPAPMFHGTMILLGPVVRKVALTDPDRFRLAP
jgi:hypothetical protein